MTNEQWPGLIGRTLDHLCNQPSVDTGLALGGALDVVARVAAGRYAAPFVGLMPADSKITKLAGIDVTEARDRTTELDRIAWGATLVGSEEDCKRVIASAEDLLVQVLGEAPQASPRGRMGRLSYWSEPVKRPFWIPPPGDGLDGPLLIGASGIHRKITHTPSDPPADLVRDLRAILNAAGLVVVEMDGAARETFRGTALQALCDTVRCGDPGPALRRWMFVLTLVAIGIDPRRPLITEDLLEPAAWVGAGAHSLLLMSFQPERHPN